MKAIFIKDDPQLQRYLDQFHVGCKLNGTWCELFKTKSYLRLHRHMKFSAEKFQSLITRKYNPVENTWTVKKVPELGWVLFWRDE